MKNLLLALVAVLMAYSATAQEKYPQGLYMSFGEIVSKSPSVQTDSVKVERRNVGMNGGNDYKLISQSKTIKKHSRIKSGRIPTATLSMSTEENSTCSRDISVLWQTVKSTSPSPPPHQALPPLLRQ